MSAPTETTPAPAPAPGAPAPAPSQTPEPAPQHWSSALDADLRQEPTFGRYKTLNDLAKGFLETKARLSQKGLVLPGKDAKPEAWGEVWKALGRPDKPEDYDLGDWKAPEGIDWSEEFQTDMLRAFHEAGATPGMVQSVLRAYGDRAAKMAEQMKAQESEVVAGWGESLRREWGSALDAKLDLAERTFTTYFPDDVQEAISQARIPGGGTLSDHPAFLKAMAAIGEQLAEHQLLGDKEPTRFAKTPEEAAREIARLKGDGEFTKKLFDKKHPEYAETNALWLRLHEQAERR